MKGFRWGINALRGIGIRASGSVHWCEEGLPEDGYDKGRERGIDGAIAAAICMHWIPCEEEKRAESPH